MSFNQTQKHIFAKNNKIIKSIDQFLNFVYKKFINTKISGRVFIIGSSYKLIWVEFLLLSEFFLYIFGSKFRLIWVMFFILDGVFHIWMEFFIFMDLLFHFGWNFHDWVEFHILVEY